MAQGSGSITSIVNCGKNSVLDEIWDDAYRDSDRWGEVWQQIKDPNQEWPCGYKLHGGKLYMEDCLCVPEEFAMRVVDEHHRAIAHAGFDRLKRECIIRYLWPDEGQLDTHIRAVRAGCLTCQRTVPPNVAQAQPLEMSPIPQSIMRSVCLDVFSMDPVEWEGVGYDSVLVCVDRHSGWIVARPTTLKGLTGAKAADLLLSGAWDIFGIPSVITSDMGSQFISSWWRTMCARMGARQAYSQAYRPQANGRAEAAVHQLKSVLRKLHADEGINWVEALPRALRIHHDLVGVSGWSPHEVLFGRRRPMAGIPYCNPQVCEEATEFYDRLEELDERVRKIITKQHQTEVDRLNRTRKSKEPYAVGDWV